MELDVLNYFLIVLGGFGLVWSFRKGYRIKEKLGDFEYLAFSAFWGALLFILFETSFKGNIEKFTEAIKIPFRAGISLFMLAVILGYILGWIFRKINKKEIKK